MSQGSPGSYEVELPKSLQERIETIARIHKLSKEQKAKLEEAVKAEYLRTRFQPGETIGVLAAHSISEPATQMTMRTFHIAGAAAVKVTLGLPRLAEIFDARPTKTPMMTIYLKSKYNTETMARRLAESIVERSLLHLIKRVSLDLKAGTIELELAKRGDATRSARALKKFVNLVVKTRENFVLIKPKGERDVKTLQSVKDAVLGTLVSGIPGISDAVVQKIGERWTITTVGTNLAEVLKMKEVDGTRTLSNDPFEIASILGIEAARNLIVREVIKTLAEQGLDVDIRHVMLVADLMTHRGRVEGLNRYGVMKTKRSVLSRAGFEETVTHLVRAAVRSETEPLEGIFENVMIGRVAPSGTGATRLVAKKE
jgi:DNA-directed RNA polymerase subunit A"